MTVRWRLLLTLGGIILLLVIPSAYGVSQLQRLRDLAVDLEDVHAEYVGAIGEYRAALAELDRAQRSFIITADTSGDASLLEDREIYRETMQQQLRRARRQLSELERGYEEEVAPSLGLLDSLTVATARVEDLVARGQMNEATEFFEGVKPLLDSARFAVRSVAMAVDRRGREQAIEASTVSASAARTTMLAVTIAALITIVLGLWTTGALSSPLRRLSRATQAVAGGEFGAPVDLPYDRNDEIGDLSRAFQAMTAQLAELDRLKAEFVGLATHELKTPINVIAGYNELLREGLYGDVTGKQAEVLSLVQEQTRSLTRLVNQLLDLSRFEAGGLRIEPGPVKVERLLQEVEGSFRALATQKQITFDIEADPSLPESIVIDHDRVRHEVLSNLLSNAFKFTDKGGRVDVHAWSEDGQVHMRVSDTGVGIPPDHLEHIFDKYYQLEGEAKGQGSGLGLAIAKHVVEAHGGRIRARSEVGEGTTFDIYLPVEGPPS